MLFDLQNLTFLKEAKTKYVGINFIFYYSGFIYIDGRTDGPESLELFDLWLDYDHDAIKKLRGSYFIIAERKNKTEAFVFTDNSGMIKAYLFKNYVSDSFVEILNNISDDLHLNYNNLAHFIHFGLHLPNESFFVEIEILKRTHFLWSKINSFHCESKNLPALSEKPDINIDIFFRNLAYALKNRTVSCDLSGGFDSRLNAVFLQFNRCIFRTSLSGRTDNKDYKIAKELASVLGVAFDFYVHKKEGLNFEDLSEMVVATDGQIDPLVFHRNYFHLKQRLSEHADIMIHGAGGEMFKDFWWLHDFPFYRKKKVNLSKLYSLRVESVDFQHKFLHGRLNEASKKLKNNLINDFKKFKATTNSQTFDQIYFNYKMAVHAKTYISVNSKFIKCYAPLMEYDLVRLGYNLPRSLRVFNFFHRKNISLINIKASKIVTTDNTSASINFRFILSDIFLFAINAIQRLAKQVLRKVMQRNYFMESPNNPEYFQDFLSVSGNKQMFLEIKNYGLIPSGIDEKDIPTEVQSRLFTIYIVLKIVKGNIV